MSPDSTPAVWLEPAHSDLKWHSSVSVLKMVFSFRLFLQFSQLCLCFSERLDWFCVSTLKHCVVFNPPVREKLLMKRTSPEHTALYYQTSRDINICGLRLKSSDLFSLVCCFSWFYILNWVSNILMTFRETLNHFDITAILKKYLRNVWKTHVPLNASWETSEKHMCLWMHHTWNIWKTHVPLNASHMTCCFTLFRCVFIVREDEVLSWRASWTNRFLTRQIVLQMISFYSGGFLQTRNLFAVFHIQHGNAAWFGLLLHFETSSGTFHFNDSDLQSMFVRA